jgi:hypothetical protein
MKEVPLKKKGLILAIACVVSGLIITAWAVTGGFQGKPPEPVERKSKLYRGLTVEPVYSQSYLEENPTTYTFAAALQGDIVKHDFIIKNKTENLIELKKVKSCCGSFIENYSRKIQPGQEGKITVIMLTDRFGGRSIQGTIHAMTNDPEQPEIQIHVSLPVIEFARIDPLKIILKGSFREELSGVSTVEPADDYPFTITGIKLRKGIDIRCSYKEISAGSKKKYVVTAINKRKKKGIYRDIMYVQTDSAARPELKIRVEGYIED